MDTRTAPVATSDNPDRILAEQVTLLYRQARLMLPASILVVGLTVYLMWGYVPRGPLLVWMGCAWTMAAARMFMVRTFLRLGEPPDMRRWGHYAVVASAVYGTILAAGSWMFASASDPLVGVLWCVLIIGIISSAMSAQAAFLPAFIALAVPTLSILALALVVAEAPALNALGIVTFLYLLVAVSYARNVNRTVTEALRLRFENEDLARQLGIEKARSDEASAAKSRFFAAANHDLRQPLHALGLFTEALQREVHTDGGKRLLRNLQSSSAALEGLVSKLLDMSKVESGTVEVAARPFELMPLLRNVHMEFAPQAESKGLRFRVRNTRDFVCSDPLLLERILRNLISNAIRYTKKGSILVSCRPRGSDVAIEVRDSGIGIPAAQRERIFESFYQLENPERDRDKGFGLGLAIVRGLAELMGHGLSVRSVEGRGSTFCVRLPRASAVSVDPVSVMAGSLVDLRVLVIDDDAAVRTALAEVLAAWGCVAALHDSVAEVLDLNADFLPDVIIADYRLRDGHNGVDAVRALRDQFGAPIAALIVTGDTDPLLAQGVARAGFHLLHKPVRPAKLRAFMAKVAAQGRRY